MLARARSKKGDCMGRYFYIYLWLVGCTTSAWGAALPTGKSEVITRFCGIFQGTRFGFGIKSVGGREHEFLLEGTSQDLKNEVHLLEVAAERQPMSGCVEGVERAGIDSMLLVPHKFDKLKETESLIMRRIRLCGVMQKKPSRNSFEIVLDTGKALVPVMAFASGDEVRKEFDQIELNSQHLVCIEGEVEYNQKAFYPAKPQGGKAVIETLD